jgi:AmiR/NasT family two-component response regulator
MAHRTGVGQPPTGASRPPDQFAALQFEIEHLRRALGSRDVIGQAKGVLMERFKIAADEAFALLVHASQHQNVRVADLSGQVAETGEWLGPVPA